MLRNHEPGCTQTELFPVLLLPRYYLRKRSRLYPKRGKPASDFRPRHRLLPLLEQRSLGRSLRHGSAFRVGIRGSERYRTLLQLLGPNTSPLSRAFQSRWIERTRAPERTARSLFSRVKKLPGRDRTILRLKTKEMSNRWIAGRLGLSEKAVRKSLRRLGWKPGPEPSLSFLPEARSQVQLAVASASTLLETPPSVTDQPAEKMPQLPTEAAAKVSTPTLSIGPWIVFLPPWTSRRCPSGVCCHTKLAKAGVLLAIPLLVASGLLSTAEKLWQPRPAFYGLRTTLVTYVLLAL